MSEWKNGILGEIINLKRGYDLPKGIRETGEYPLYSSSGLSDRINEYKVKGPGVITGRYGSIGEVFYSSNDFWPLNTTLYVEDFKGNNEKFIYYYLKTINYSQFNDKSAVPGINRNHLHELAVKIPPLPVQRRIAAILSSLDDKIENNRKTYEKLEEIAQAIFKRWFVDFEFPNEEGLPYKLSGGDMVFCEELGKEMPKGWSVVPLEDTFIFQEGPGIRNWQYVQEDGVKFINIRCIQNNDLLLDTANMISHEEACGKYAHFLVDEWDLLMSTSGTLGRCAIARKEHLPLCMNTSVIRFKPKSDKGYAFMFSYLTSAEFYNHLITKGSGSVQANFGPMHLKQISLVYPPFHVLSRYDEIVFSLIKASIQRKKENSLLQQVRDNLLPKLMSGELLVDEVEDVG